MLEKTLMPWFYRMGAWVRLSCNRDEIAYGLVSPRLGGSRVGKSVWIWSALNGPSGNDVSLEAAKSKCDIALVEMGWRLLDAKVNNLL